MLGERAGLTSDVLRTNAIATAAAASDGPTAAQALQRTRAFGYRADFAGHADTRAAERGQSVLAAETARIRQQAVQQRQQAVASVRDTAVAALTKHERKALPFTTSSTGVEAAGKLLVKQQQLSAPAVANINLQENQGLLTAQQVTAPNAETTRRGEFQAWFQSVGHHPDALAALTAAEDDFTLATSLVTTISAQGSTRQLLIASGLSSAAIGQVLRILPAQLAYLVTGGVDAGDFKAFANTDARTRVLNALALAMVPPANVRGLVSHLATLDAQISSPTEYLHLVTLLATTTAADIVAMCKAAPDPANAKLTLLAAIRAKAAVAADLTTVLKFCTDARWDHTRVVTALAPLANGRTLAQLFDAVHAAELARYNRINDFAGWLQAVDRLIPAGYLNIQANGGWRQLRGEPLTEEQQYDVVIVSTGAVHGSFVVHFHPTAQGATVNNQNASRAHLKPGTQGNTRYTSPDMLTHIRSRIALHS